MPFQFVPETTTFDPVPDGEYYCKVVKSEEKTSQKPEVGSFLNLHLEITDGEHTGKKLFQNCFFHTDGARKYSTMVLRGLGLEMEDGEPFELEPEELLGAEAHVFVEVKQGDVNTATGERYDDKSEITKWFRD